jgi:U4/U6 small nuclear ribonucleoprotein PRP31
MSLAQSLLDDLDGLSDDEPEVTPSAAAPAGKGKSAGEMMPPPPMPVAGVKRSLAADLESDDEDAEGDVKMEDGSSAVGYVPNGGVRPADELDADEVNRTDLAGVEDVSKVAKLVGGKKLKEVLDVSLARRFSSASANSQGIERYTAEPTDMSSTSGGPLEENPEYHLVVTANNMSVEVDNEILLVHKFIRDHYGWRFPELEQLITDPWTYIAAVQAIGNVDDLTRAVMPSTLPPATVLSITLTATSSRGRVLSQTEWVTTQRAMDVALQLRSAREEIFKYVESRMSAVAPNISAIVGTGIAAKLLGLAGGLHAFSRAPSCNIMLYGAMKKSLANSHLNAATQQRHTGFIFQSEIVQSAQPQDRRRAQRVVSAKVSLAARIDANKSDRDGNFGRKMLADLTKRIEKMSEPPPTKITKALPIPQETARKKRGGRK